MTTPQTIKTSFVESPSVKYAYRKLGPSSGVPLLLFQFFRATMDHWDPLLVSLLSASRQVILFDNAGVGQSTGENPDSVAGMAEHVEAFLEALNIDKVDLLGFSIGGTVAQQVALDTASKGLVRKMILSATSPGRGTSGGEDIVDADDPTIQKLAGTPETSEEAFHKLFFYPSDSSREAGSAWFKRIAERNESTSGEEREKEVQGKGIMAQSMALGKWAKEEGVKYL